MLVGIMLSAALLLAPCAGAFDVEQDLQRLLTEAPSSELFEGSNGLILLREIKYSLTADGSMERTTFLVFEEVSRLVDVLPEVEIAPPEGGKLEILEAAVFGRDTLRRTLPLLPESAFGVRSTPVSVRVPSSLDGNVMVLGFKQTWPGRVNVEDRVAVSLSLPQWEQRIIVEVPKGSDFYWKTEGMDPPVMERGNLKDKYEWTSINVRPKRWNSIFVHNEPVIAFSMREGLKRSLEAGYEYIQYLADILEPVYVKENKINGANKTKRGFDLLSELNAKTFHPLDLSGTLPAGADTLKGKGLLTQWESAALAWRLLGRMGWETDLFFLPAVETEGKVPGSLALWEAPVVYVKPPSGEGFFYKFGQIEKPGAVASGLYGRTMLGLKEGEVTRETVSAQPAQKHLLELQWDLSLSSEGKAEGFLYMKASGAWISDLLEEGQNGKEGVRKFMGALRFQNVSGVSLRDAEIDYKGSAFTVTLPVDTNLGIVGQDNLLVRWPTVFMPWQEEVLDETESAKIRHPFVFQQKLKLRLPDGYKVLVLPTTGSYEKEGVSLLEDVRIRGKGKVLEGETKLVAAGSSLSGEKLDILKALMTRLMRWKDVTVPLQKKP
ncbi:hypothetical protein [Thermovirga lienii]|uniref:hypothetical protein n=1 Tax=Thermovirga lienii TaxID=336261 RepID=UPI002FE17874